MLKLVIFDPKIIKNIFEIICILRAAKNYTSNSPDTYVVLYKFSFVYGLCHTVTVLVFILSTPKIKLKIKEQMRTGAKILDPKMKPSHSPVASLQLM